jgi:DNA modification methylase
MVLKENAMSLPLSGGSVDSIVSSPPYFGALDYGRDNRLRLWFLGVDDYRTVEAKLTSNERVYIPQMRKAVGEMLRVLKPRKFAILVLGDYNRNGRKQDSASALESIVREDFHSSATVERLLVDEVPDIRRSRRRTRTTMHETIVVIKKLDKA